VERWLLPAECLLCERPVPRSDDDALVCGICRSRWVPVPDPACSRCGQPLEEGVDCRLCADWPAGFGGVRSAVWLLGSARQAVHWLKYQGWWRVADALAPAMTRLRPTLPGAVLVPVPLGAARERERGYNQSAVLAHALSRGWGAEVRSGTVRRVRETSRQTELAPGARQANVAGAFVATWPDRRPAVLVDDVFTTGATLAALATALLRAGAPAVSGVTFARARRPLDDAVEELGPGES
jgi:ComF family protein